MPRACACTHTQAFPLARSHGLPTGFIVMAYVVVAYVGMAYIVVAYICMAFTVMAFTVMAPMAAAHMAATAVRPTGTRRQKVSAAMDISDIFGDFRGMPTANAEG